MTGKRGMDEMYLIPMQQQMSAARREMRECNAYSGRFGLMLRENEIAELAESRAEVLRASGRIEFGGGILPKLIRAFCGRYTAALRKPISTCVSSRLRMRSV